MPRLLVAAAGADPTLDDNLGRSALLEACYNGHDGIIDTLTFAGVRLAPQAANKAAGSSSSNGGSSGSARMSTSGSVRSNISGSNTINRFGPAAIIGSQDLAAAGSYGSMTPSGDQLSAGSSKNASWALQLASLLCNCVYECNLPLLRRLLRAGAPVNLGDYDRRTALHISAAEGNNVMVRMS
jgi:ankyrin repeat protein